MEGVADKRHARRQGNLPKDLADKVEEVIDSGKHGYTTISDFVKEATRRYLRELGYLK